MAKGFGDSVRESCQRALEEIDKKCFSITWQFFTSVVQLTPVDSGLLKNSWYPQIGPSFSSSVGTFEDKSGSGSLSRITALANKGTFLGKDGSMTMANNLSYAYRAEYRGWPKEDNPNWSGRVGPYRMVALSLQKVVAQNK